MFYERWFSRFITTVGSTNVFCLELPAYAKLFDVYNTDESWYHIRITIGYYRSIGIRHTQTRYKPYNFMLK